MRVLAPDEASQKLGIALRSIIDKRYRLRIGLPAVKIGKKIGFLETDVERLIAKGREKLPTRTTGGEDVR